MMDAERAHRKLAAIFVADVESYSRHMEEDEVSALRMLYTHRAVLTTHIAQHGGRVANTAGDSILAEFASVVDAVDCATAAQADLARANADHSPERKMQFRIGIHVGDVLTRDGDLFGDGVNIAARVQALAKPGGICMSGAARDHLGSKLPIAFTDGGEQVVKNIVKPIRLFHAEVSAARKSEVALPLPDKPSIAVLPFTNMSGDPEQEYFVDGITEDIITALSKWRWFFVIARNSTFVYKGRSAEIKQVARELGVHYVVEGSVRKAGNRVRITAQLIEAATAQHVWAEKYDRDLTDIFAVQDEITERIVTAIDPALRGVETRRAMREPAIKAWDHVLRGMAEFSKYEKDANLRAREHFTQAIEIDPRFAIAHAHLAGTYHFASMLGWSDQPEEAVATGYAIAERAVAVDDMEAVAHAYLAVLSTTRRYHDKALAAGRRAVQLNPNYSRGQGSFGRALLYAGQFEDAIRHFETFLRLSPHEPLRWVIFGGLAVAHYMLGHYEKATWLARESLALRPEPYLRALMVLVASLTRLGKKEEARQACDELNRLTSGNIAAYVPIELAFRDQEYIDRITEDICTAQK